MDSLVRLVAPKISRMRETYIPFGLFFFMAGASPASPLPPTPPTAAAVAHRRPEVGTKKRMPPDVSAGGI